MNEHSVDSNSNNCTEIESDCFLDFIKNFNFFSKFPEAFDTVFVSDPLGQIFYGKVGRTARAHRYLRCISFKMSLRRRNIRGAEKDFLTKINDKKRELDNQNRINKESFSNCRLSRT